MDAALADGDSGSDGGRGDAAASEDGALVDAGASACRLVYGPAEQTFRGPAALAPTPTELRLVTNDSGKPRIYTVPLNPPRDARETPPRPTTFTGMRWPPCELAGRFAYCQGPGGTITRTSIDGVKLGDGKTIAKSRSGTRIAAAPLGADHTAVSFLDVRRTTEGDMLQAFVALDERDPVRLSDDGAGATTLRALPRGQGALVAYLDTRTAMVPVHVRSLVLKGDELSLADDVVVFVGGAPERGIDFAFAHAGAKTFALVPMPQETMDFGMAALVVEDPPKDAVSAVWSRYPNGLDPAPIAAVASRDGKTAWVARLRPAARDRHAPRVLELGRIDETGAFQSLGVIGGAVSHPPDAGGSPSVPAADPVRPTPITDVALAEDRFGAIWVLYGDSTATWLERRVCF